MARRNIDPDTSLGLTLSCNYIVREQCTTHLLHSTKGLCKSFVPHLVYKHCTKRFTSGVFDLSPIIVYIVCRYNSVRILYENSVQTSYPVKLTLPTVCNFCTINSVQILYNFQISPNIGHKVDLRQIIGPPWNVILKHSY